MSALLLHSCGHNKNLDTSVPTNPTATESVTDSDLTDDQEKDNSDATLEDLTEKDGDSKDGEDKKDDKKDDKNDGKKDDGGNGGNSGEPVTEVTPGDDDEKAADPVDPGTIVDPNQDQDQEDYKPDDKVPSDQIPDEHPDDKDEEVYNPDDKVPSDQIPDEHPDNPNEENYNPGDAVDPGTIVDPNPDQPDPGFVETPDEGEKDEGQTGVDPNAEVDPNAWDDETPTIEGGLQPGEQIEDGEFDWGEPTIDLQDGEEVVSQGENTDGVQVAAQAEEATDTQVAAQADEATDTQVAAQAEEATADENTNSNTVVLNEGESFSLDGAAIGNGVEVEGEDIMTSDKVDSVSFTGTDGETTEVVLNSGAEHEKTEEEMEA